MSNFMYVKIGTMAVGCSDSTMAPLKLYICMELHTF